MNPPNNVHRPVENPEIRPFRDLRDKGLLWMINTTVFHPRGMYFALCYEKGVDPSDPNVHPIGFLVREVGEQMVYTDEDASSGYRAFCDYLGTVHHHPGPTTVDETDDPDGSTTSEDARALCPLCNRPLLDEDVETPISFEGENGVETRNVHVRCVADFERSRVTSGRRS